MGSAFAQASRPRGVFVTGTDTGAGKTMVSVAIVAALVRRGLRVGVYKPAETGCAESDGTLRGEDGELLLRAAAARSAPQQEAVSSYLLRQPAAPLVAAEAEGVRIDPERLIADFAAIRERSDFVLVEGAGGLLVPIADGFTYRELAARIGLPVLCVVASRLGCINHALLTLEAIAAARLPLAGYVVNQISDDADAALSNRATIARFAPRFADGPARDLGLLSFVAESARGDFDALAAAAERCLNMDALLGG